MAFSEENVLNALRDVYDPELPVNIVDLGLIYRVDVEPDPDAPGMVPRQKVEIDITMTSKGCPSHERIIEQVRNRLAGEREISATNVNLVWEPAWGPQRISEAARKQLGIE
ncbi:metal-sulfur cluster assembly factor [Silvibacterium acidisoli]|uniref:metal-sulfur cluster assembly factor n=1 Tax=Acidobacteriaceae bacterium ZG23-2 TaxID=2883246 RepID=UPI00406C2B53